MFRDTVIKRLTEDLIGPLTEGEVFADRPTQRYSTGILYPRGSRIEPDEDQDGSAASDDQGDAAADEPVALHSALKPSAAGFSFAVKATEGGTLRANFEVSCAVYRRIAINAEGQEMEGPPAARQFERWRRIPCEAKVQIPLVAGEKREPLDPYSIPGLELYILAVPHGNVLTVTAALSNKRSRGENSVFDEEQHFFQVGLTVASIEGGELAPRPPRRAKADDDSRTAALIYRDVREYVVGHTCSARAIEEGGQVRQLMIDWMPVVTVPGISDQGSPDFQDLYQESSGPSPLKAEWLATAAVPDLVKGLRRVVAAYKQWIESERTRIPRLGPGLQERASEHLRRCEHGAKRIAGGVALIESRRDVAHAFQLAQSAMHIQFGWLRPGQKLFWRPFQIAFQLLVLASLSEPSNEDRATMDLLWFPTGGGKTEAYLTLTAFIIFLRRLRPTKEEDGAGVAVLMRYTLRLLTVQQFQRASAMIMACEMIRRRSEKKLGVRPIGIGLWVGAAATPLTLREALDRPTGHPSTPKQLINCPCCQKELFWHLAPAKSTVRCKSEPAQCEFAATGPELPLWTIDEEVYREKPSLLIATVDKFAQIVRKLETRNLFGRGVGESPPDLIIQDELHLISGPLGSIAGLYEVAIDELCTRGSVRPKIIGSTATIRRAEDQIRQLFDRKTFQFPPPGLDAANSGFAVADPARPGRVHVGLTTAGRSATYMLQAIVASLLQTAADSGVPPKDRDWYWTLVMYFNSLRELGRALVLMQDDVPISIGQFAARRGETKREIEAPAELTSRVPSHDVRDMLLKLNREIGDSECVDLLLASNMISVGMDIPRLGLMVVNAQPKTLSEYIQATSRVGRGSVPGLVVTMYNAMRARDRSRYETFATWHQCLYRDVEATSVTPFASRAQDKALHAVLVALVRHMVPGMDLCPVLRPAQRAQAERICSEILHRVDRVDIDELPAVTQKLTALLDEWESRPDLEAYWDDFDRRRSLLMSAEQYAALTTPDPDLDADVSRRALWPAPNSMREVEPGTPFVLRNVLRSDKLLP